MVRANPRVNLEHLVSLLVLLCYCVHLCQVYFAALYWFFLFGECHGTSHTG